MTNGSTLVKKIQTDFQKAVTLVTKSLRVISSENPRDGNAKRVSQCAREKRPPRD